MHAMAGKPFARFPEAKVKVKRSEFEDGTIKSLVREGTRLGQTLKQYDRARKVVRKELERDRRQAAKLSRKIRTADLFHSLSLHGDGGGNGETMHPRTSQRRHRDGTSTSPRSPSTTRNTGLRAKTAKASLKVNEDTAVQSEHSDACKQSFDRKHQLTSKVQEVNWQRHIAASSESSAHESLTRNTSRKKLFDDLSKPKNRSDVLSVRQRLQNEFGKQRPHSSQVSTGRVSASPRVVIHGSGPNAVCMLTTRSPNRAQTLSARDKSVVDEVDGSQYMSAADLQILLSSPSPVVVKRDPDKR